MKEPIEIMDLPQDPDTIAGVLMAVGATLAIGEFSYQVMTGSISVDVDIGLDFGTIGDIPDIAKGGLPALAKTVTRFMGNPLKALRGVTAPKIAPEGGVTVDFFRDDNSLWGDYRIAAAGVGMMVGGFLYLVAHHPEWISGAMEAGKEYMIKTQESIVAINNKIMEKIPDVEDLGTLTSSLTSLLPLLGIATAIPGIPPPP